MKNTLIIIVLLIAGCSNSGNRLSEQKISEVKLAPLTIYYFHVTNRCATCISVEANTRKVLENYFSEPLSKGVISLRVINADDPSNREICKKYEAFGSALHIVKNENGKETDSNLTNIAFSYSLRQPERFMNILLDTISAQIR